MELNYIILALPIIAMIVLGWKLGKGGNKEIPMNYADPNTRKGKMQRLGVFIASLVFLIVVITFNALRENSSTSISTTTMIVLITIGACIGLIGFYIRKNK